jgi:L-lactate dehydrogenase complex protein LldG
MPDNTDARTAILSGIRASLGPPSDAAAIAAGYAAVPRNYKRVGTLAGEALLALFMQRLAEYGAGVHRATPEGLRDAIARILAGRGRKRIAVPEGLPAAWLPSGPEFQNATDFDYFQLDKADSVLTGCTVAIAETGSIVLQNAPAQGPRRLSLLPDHHLCVVLAGQVVETVPEAFARLETTATLPTTFISGPSATADIEMTRIQGVHGPRLLDVLLVA